MKIGMGKNYWIITIGLVLVTIIASNLAFLPGPSWLYRPSQILYNSCSLLGLMSLITVPIGLIALAIIYKKEEGRTKYALKAFFLLLVILGLIFSINLADSLILYRLITGVRYFL